jgi:hypothetical protein
MTSLKTLVILAAIVSLSVTIGALSFSLYQLKEDRPYIEAVNIRSYGNDTCSGPVFNNPRAFIFDLRATLTNTGGRAGYADVLFQLDNATMQDKTYFVAAHSQIEISAYRSMGYCQYSGKQTFDIVILSQWRA